jgi:putative membrane-bound dehydrogenase-like protein
MAGMKYCVTVVGLLAEAGVALGAFEDRGADRGALPAVAEGFEVRVVAKEPMVRNPCSLAFDAEGRMYVSQGPQYRSPRVETPMDEIVVLTDRDGDGEMDGAAVFARGFNCIQGMAWHGGDLWVANAPDLTVVRDRDGDGRADEYVRVFTDLGNIEHGLHGLTWAPDGRLYMSKGNSRGVVLKEMKADEPWRLAPRAFRELWGESGPAGAAEMPPVQTFAAAEYRAAYQDPADDWGRMGGILRCGEMGAGLEIVARGCRNPYGLAFSGEFDWLTVDQDQNEGDRLLMPFAGAEYGWSHGWSTHWTGERHLPTVPVSGPVFQGSGTGVVFVDVPTWPAEWRGVFLVNDWLLKRTQVFRPSWDGSLMVPEGGKWGDFVRGGESLYRPVDMAVGPDGGLYVTGWGSGYGVEWDEAGKMSNEGRVFRVMPRGAAAMRPLSKKSMVGMTAGELIEEFDGVLPVRRVAAQDELVRRGAAVVGEMREALDGGELSATASMWVMWGMARAGVGAEEFTGRYLKEGAVMRERLQSLRVLGFLKTAELMRVLPRALKEEEPRLRLATVLAVREAGLAAAVPLLVEHAAVERDRLTYFATWRCLRDLGGAAVLKRMVGDERGGVRCAGLLGLLDLGGADGAMLARLAGDADENVRVVAQLGMGKRSRAERTEAVEETPDVYPLVDEVKVESGRGVAVGELRKGVLCYTDRPYRFGDVPALVDGSCLLRLANEDDASVGEKFLTFELPVAATVMVGYDERIRERPAWMREFADTDLRVGNGDTEFRLWSREFPAGRVTLGGNLAGRERGPKANYFVVIRPAALVIPEVATTEEMAMAALGGADVRRGGALFFHGAGCAACHRVAGRGINFGPDLSGLGSRMDAKGVVRSMLDPNAVITEGYAAHVVEAGGQTHFGMLLSTGKVLRLGVAGGKTVEIPEGEITKHETLRVSPMPPQGGLLGVKEVADIAAWLLTQRETGGGEAKVAGALSFRMGEGRVEVMRGETVAAEFHFGHAVVKRPFFANLRVAGGIAVTRGFPPVEGREPVDHGDMHPGVWLGFGDVSGEDYWRNRAVIRHDRFVEGPTVVEGAVRFATESTMLKADGSEFARMVNRIVVRDDGMEMRLEWKAEVTPLMDGFQFGDQEEMGFGVRVASGLAERSGGVIRSSGGKESAAETWGQEAEWCEYSGVVNGVRAGVRVVPDPDNFRASWWHNRDYGLMVANPFGRAAMKRGERSVVAVKKGETFRLGVSMVFSAGAEP